MAPAVPRKQASNQPLLADFADAKATTRLGASRIKAAYRAPERRPSGAPARRSAGALGASAALHGAALVALALLFPPPQSVSQPAYYLLAYVGSGAGPPGAGLAGGSPPAGLTSAGREFPPAARAAAAAGARGRRRARPRLPLASTPHRLQPDRTGRPYPDRSARPPPAPAAGGGSPGAAFGRVDSDGQGAGGGNGQAPGAGDGSGAVEARAGYGENPLPPYPETARRDNQQGDVLLRVLVAADGTVERVELARSCGFDLLDESALETVRTRWHFVPARRTGVRVASWVLVPIRFSLKQARAAR